MSRLKGGLLVEIMLDSSGSMDERQQGVIEGFNELREQLSLIAMPPTLIVSKFSYHRTIIKTPTPVYDIAPLTTIDYICGGGTQLCGSIRKALAELHKHPYAAKALVIVSDGEDGEPPQNTADKVREARAAGMMVLFIGTDLDALKVGQSLGVDPALCLQFGGRKTKAAMEAAAEAIIRFNATRKEGEAGFTEQERAKAR